MGFTGRSGQGSSEAYRALSKELGLDIWLEAAKLPAACPSLKPWEICHKLEYQNLENTSGGAPDGEFMFSAQFRDFADNLEQRESDTATNSHNMEHGTNPSEVPEADPIHHELLKFLFSRACRPYFDFIKSWLYRAVVKDPYNEFIVEASENVEPISNAGKRHANHLPVPSIKVRNGVSIPCFLKHVCTPLLRAGQQLQVLIRLLEITEIRAELPLFASSTMPGAASSRLSNLEAILDSRSYFLNEDASCEPVLVYSKSKLEDLMQKREEANRQMVEKLDSLFADLNDVCRQKEQIVVPVKYISEHVHKPADYGGITQQGKQLVVKGDHTEKGNNISASTPLCKRFHAMGSHQFVLRKASTSAFSVKASSWCEGAHRFIKKCADSGNVEACYTLGMIRFYCLQNRGRGASLMAKAAISSHAPALYSLAIIQFNGSGGGKKDKDLKAGVALCARAAFLGHIDALRELGHCLQDGYGISKNVAEGRRFLVQANARELASVYPPQYWKSQQNLRALRPAWIKNLRTTTTLNPALSSLSLRACPLLSDFGCNVPPPESHPAAKFMVEWFKLRAPCAGLRLCSYAGCGRPETRKHEFRRCSVCGTVNYCSRACQALDWKIRHKHSCMPIDDWLDADTDDDEDYPEEEEEPEDQI